jgi:hypothetical protein
VCVVVVVGLTCSFVFVFVCFVLFVCACAVGACMCMAVTWYSCRFSVVVLVLLVYMCDRVVFGMLGLFQGVEVLCVLVCVIWFEVCL